MVNTTDRQLLIVIQYVCNESAIKIPWDRAAEVLSDLVDGTITEGAIVQHLAKLRLRLDEEGAKITPPLRKGGSRISFHRKALRTQETPTKQKLTRAETLNKKAVEVVEAAPECDYGSTEKKSKAESAKSKKRGALENWKRWVDATEKMPLPAKGKKDKKGATKRKRAASIISASGSEFLDSPSKKIRGNKKNKNFTKDEEDTKENFDYFNDDETESEGEKNRRPGIVVLKLSLASYTSNKYPEGLKTWPAGETDPSKSSGFDQFHDPIGDMDNGENISIEDELADHDVERETYLKRKSNLRKSIAIGKQRATREAGVSDDGTISDDDLKWHLKNGTYTIAPSPTPEESAEYKKLLTKQPGPNLPKMGWFMPPPLNQKDPNFGLSPNIAQFPSRKDSKVALTPDIGQLESGFSPLFDTPSTHDQSSPSKKQEILNSEQKPSTLLDPPYRKTSNSPLGKYMSGRERVNLSASLMECSFRVRNNIPQQHLPQQFTSASLLPPRSTLSTVKTAKLENSGQILTRSGVENSSLAVAGPSSVGQPGSSLRQPSFELKSPSSDLLQ
ncbi:MAG: hypothetical protein M1829_005797 [Trizodia sp. TS-e1964]|nr:MAG: hypothetical protein M1829_005797 [Trizodia sp. TS-e1964]